MAMKAFVFDRQDDSLYWPLGKVTSAKTELTGSPAVNAVKLARKNGRLFF
jgi:hypothetical protein